MCNKIIKLVYFSQSYSRKTKTWTSLRHIVYGYELWKLKNPATDQLCKALCAGIRCNWRLLYNCHSATLHILSNALPLQDLISGL